VRKAAALAILIAYSWPGNVRELENASERSVTFSQGAIITPEALPERIRSTGGAALVLGRASEKTLSMREVEREYILEILRRTDGNKKRAAELLGLDRKTLYRKLEEYRAEGLSSE
jgi:DNA-binding NtrC family response regulator